MKQFKVSAKHKAARFNFTDELVLAKPAPGHDGYWYAVGSLGCSKDYRKPEWAVNSLFADAACYDIRIVEEQS